MKYLSEYTEAAQTAAFEKAQAFFAFSTKQLNEGLDKYGLTKEKVCSMGAGLVAPKANATQLFRDLEQIQKTGIAADIADNGIDAIILRELHNHECFYTGDTEPCVDKLADYGITKEQIYAVYSSERQKDDVWA